MGTIQLEPPSFAMVNGRAIAYHEMSSAEPQRTVLLIPGINCKRHLWWKQFADFGAHYRVIAMDPRDIGDSFQAKENYTTADQAEDAAGLLRALGVTRAHVVGFSMGGFIAQELTLRHPDMVERLVLSSTSAGGPSLVFPDWELLLLFQALLWSPRLSWIDMGAAEVSAYARLTAPGYYKRCPEDKGPIAQLGRYRPQPAAAFARQFYTCMTHNTVGRLPTIAAPTLVIHGEDDRLLPLANGLYLARTIPGAQLLRLPYTGHFSLLERTAEYNAAVLGFLRGEEAGEKMSEPNVLTAAPMRPRIGAAVNTFGS